MVNPLQVIAQYDLSPEEANAYKLGAIFTHLVRKMFPQCRCPAMSGDPRKKEIFKWCWKALDQLGGRLGPSEYKMFVWAQLAVVKKHMNDNAPPRIHPNLLCGPGAWNRWLVFKSRLDKREQYETVAEAKIDINTPVRVVEALRDTKRFFSARFGRHNREDIWTALESKTLLRWVTCQQVCGYYVWLSPVVSSWVSGKGTTVSDYFGPEMNVYKGGVSAEAETYFRKEFAYEYEQQGT